MADERIWEEMRDRLMKLTMKQLKQTAKEEKICLGYAASRKDTLVAEIVSARRHRVMEGSEGQSLHPWREWHSVKGQK